MENKLKPETTGAIKQLQLCNIKTIMATGDNVLTGISVARQCSILDTRREVWLGDLESKLGNPVIVWKSTDKFKEVVSGRLPWRYNDDSIEVALTGKAFNHIMHENNKFIANSVLAKAKVYARMGPDDKACLVENLQNMLQE